MNYNVMYMSVPIIKIENLSHRYSVQWSVRNVSFELYNNGIYGLLGANGAGKSTTMNVMCGVLTQTEGKVFIKGVDLATNPIAAKKNIGFLPQQPPLIPELTVQEYLVHCANLRLVPSARVKQAVSDVMAKCNIDHFKNRVIKNLSGGYQQRVGIAQAIIHNPDFVVLDEPTNGLDPNQILDIRKLIREIAEERTVILSTHILQEVQALCDHLWVLNDGKLIFSGDLKEFNSKLTPNAILLRFLSLPSKESLRQFKEIVTIDELGDNTWRVHCTSTEGLVEKIIETSVCEKWRLVKIMEENESIEMVFAALTKNK